MSELMPLVGGLFKCYENDIFAKGFRPRVNTTFEELLNHPTMRDITKI